MKGTLSKALGKEAVLTAKGVQGLMEPSTFEKLAGSDGTLDAAEVRAALDSDVPDPKIYDDSPFEAARYAERRDDIGRLMLSVMMQARDRLAAH